MLAFRLHGVLRASAQPSIGGKLFNVDVTWFDGELSPTKQRKAVDNMATLKWDFVAIQALTEGTLTDPENRPSKNIPVTRGKVESGDLEC